MTRREIQFPVLGMSCANCARRLERVLRTEVPGVEAATVSLAAETATVVYDADRADLGAVEAAVARAGFRAIVPRREAGVEDEEQAVRAAEARRERRAFAVGLAFTIPLAALGMGRDLGWLGPWSSAAWFGGLLGLLATPVQFYTGLGFYRGAWAALRSRSADMNVLVALGSTTAFAFSWAVLVVPGLGDHVYFETSASIVTLIRLGKLLEASARRRASEAIRRLLELTPAVAHLRLRAGVERDVPVEVVRPGDVVVVRPGERIPVDGMVEEGEAGVDRSLLTGESVPVHRGPGEAVPGGSVVLDGRLVVRATATGAESAPARIAALVRRAQGSRAPIQRLADRVSAWFVPAIVAVAVGTFAGWWVVGGAFVPALWRLVAVLVVACPCALGLATPMAIVVGASAAAHLGILFRDGAAIEALRGVTLVFFDKTGTLTRGRPVLAEWVAADGGPGNGLLLAGAVESGSEHPVARALVAAAREHHGALPDPAGVRAAPGRGVEGTVGGRRVRVGSWSWIEAAVGPAPAGLGRRAIELAEAGRTVVGVAVEDRWAGLAAVVDEPKPGAAAAVRALRAQGLRVCLLSGDGAAAARAAARAVGIEDVRAEVLPEAKERVVREAGEGGERTAMVGDGLNDAPALAAADVGIAIGGGTEVAAEAAGVSLAGDDPLGVPRAVAVSRAVWSGIRQNLFWAFAYNGMLIPVAAGVLHGVAVLPGAIRDFHPALAAAAMAFSSLTVVLNSLRIGRRAKRAVAAVSAGGAEFSAARRSTGPGGGRRPRVAGRAAACQHEEATRKGPGRV